MKKLQVAVTAWNFGGGFSANVLAEQGEVAEKIGFDSFWLPENHFSGVAAIPAPLMLLAAIAGRTERIGLGTTSYLLPIRHPIAAAEEVAVLDRLSGGRVILGVGRGFQDDIFRVFDIPVKDKRKHFKTNLELMKAAWRGEPLPGSTPDHPIILAPLPIQQPYPRIWVAAFGPLAIKQAGSLGLPYIASPVESMASLVENYEAHRGHARDAGFRGVETVPIMRTLFISDQASLIRTIRERLAAEAPPRMRQQETSIHDWTIIGDISYVRDKIAEYQEKLNLNYLIARGRIPGVESREQIASHERLAQIVSL